MIVINPNVRFVGIPDKLHPIEHIAVYLSASGPTRFWAVERHLAGIGIRMSAAAVERACQFFPETFLQDRDHNGALIGIRTDQWMAEVGSRRSLSTAAAVKEQRLPKFMRAERRRIGLV